ncbi:MAG: FHA domain-containing protein, partial [Gemmatimonadota bacterium]|nr:FHA domain-containing protein [Gemmatimonadota bacterium]
RLFPLAAGEVTIGAFDGAGIRLPSGDPTSRAVVLTQDSGVSIRRGSPDAVVLVNGVQLGVEPTPLLHGDRVEISGHELRVGEDKQGGNTAFVSAAEVAQLVQQAGAAPPKRPTSATGGRLVSLVDGREYPVPETELTFGREVGNTIVIASSEISRRHASIVAGDSGYLLRDHSTNGVWVNGSRVVAEQTLGRGDVIKMGTEEFRFYADVPKTAPATAQSPPAKASLAATQMGMPAMPRPGAPPPAQTAAPPPPPAIAPTAVSSAVPAPPPPVRPAMPPAARPAAAAPEAPAPIVEPPTVPSPAPSAAAPPAAPAAPVSSTARQPTRQPLAVLEVIAEGPLKGTKFELHSALTNIGRGEHNDIAIRDDSISDSHAKLQKRPDGWYVVDQGSTNGTYVGGRRVEGEHRIEGAPDLRFGGIKMRFRPAVVAAGEIAGTRAIAAVNVEAIKARAQGGRAAGAPKVTVPAVPDAKKKGCATVIALVVTIAGAGVGVLGLLLFVGR